jgi:hypothetical protein
MVPYFPVDERLKEETDVIITRLTQKNKPKDEIVKELAGFLNQHYGTVISNDFYQWIQEIYPAFSKDAAKAYAAAKTQTEELTAAAIALKPVEPAQKDKEDPKKKGKGK